MKKFFDWLFNKKNEKEHGNKHDRIDCDFGVKKFNQRKRPIEEAPGGTKGKPPKGGGTQPPPPPPPTTQTGGTIFLDFWGGTVSNTMWNVYGSYTVQDAGLSQIEIDYVVTQVKKHYEGFNVVVTTDVDVFNATPIGRRIRVMITESWEWFGQAGGVAYLNSFFWTDNSPAFVFSLLLGYNTHHIAEAASHEAGHSLALRHQSDCVNGVKTNEYSLGKTMGVSYDVPIGEWVTGTSSLSCQQQDDIAMLKAAVGLKV